MAPYQALPIMIHMAKPVSAFTKGGPSPAMVEWMRTPIVGGVEIDPQVVPVTPATFYDSRFHGLSHSGREMCKIRVR